VQADLLLGQATTRIPIEVAPGRKGMTPQLGLTYASRGGNGLVGRGWDLRVPCVKRSTRDGVPVDWSDDAYPYVDDEFTLVMPSGAVALDRVLGASGSNTLYASTAEEAMLRVWFSPTANTWTVTDKSGVRYEFGFGTAQNRVGPSVGSPAGPFAWGLTKVVDPSGNSIAYSYAAHGLNGATNAALYPARIDYGANAGAGYGDIFHVCFAYDAGGSSCTAAPALRPDPFVSYSGAFAAWTLHRITGIKLWTDTESTEAMPTRRYALTYAQDETSDESRLDRVEVFAGVETLRPTTFTYNGSARQIATSASHQNFASGNARAQLPLRRNSISAGTRSDLIDMNGDGRPDWVECNNQNAWQWFIYPNLGNGSFGVRQTWSGPQCAMHQYFAELLDVNGDALPDVVQQLFPAPHGTTRNWRVWYNTGAGFSSEQVFAVPPTDFGKSVTNYGIWMHPVGGNGATRDLTGDGLPDAVDSYCNCNSVGLPAYCPGEEGLCRVFLGTGSAFAAPGVLWAWPRIENAPGRTSYFESSTGRTLYTLQDMNGDGLPDLVMSRPPLDPRAGGTGFCRGGPNHEAPCSSNGQCGAGSCTHPTAWGVYHNSGTGFEFESVCPGGANNGLACGAGCPGGRCEDLPTYWAGPADSAGERMDVEQLCGHSDTPQAGWPPIGVQGGLRDMNGDGLPDYVDSNVDCDNPTTGPGWRVFINTGTNFKQSHVTWAGTAGLLVQKWGAQDDWTPGVPDPADVAVVLADTLDVDGDGIADHIEAVPSDLSRLYVRRGLGAIPGTLSKQENGLGGSIEVTYGLASAVDPLPGTAPKVCNGGSNDGSVCKWVTDCPSGTCDACTDCDHSPFPLTAVAQIVTKSGLSGTGHTLTQSYKFLAPYYDWQEREFRGFRWAVEEDAARGQRTETEFVQPGTHPRQQSTWCGAPGQLCNDLRWRASTRARSDRVGSAPSPPPSCTPILPRPGCSGICPIRVRRDRTPSSCAWPNARNAATAASVRRCSRAARRSRTTRTTMRRSRSATTAPSSGRRRRRRISINPRVGSSTARSRSSSSTARQIRWRGAP